MTDQTAPQAGPRAKLSTDPYRGTRDFLPPEMSVRTQVFGTLYRVLEAFGFVRYDGPLLEAFELYEAKSSQEIVNEQLYSLVDKGGRRLVIRPEMTPTVARMIAGHSQELALPVRWYAHVNCHRYERPQRGRLREHWQINADIFGSTSHECEVELFDLIRELMLSIGAEPSTYAIRANDRILAEAAFTNWVGLDRAALRPVLRALDKWEKVDEATREAMLQENGLTPEQIDRVKAYAAMDLEQICGVAGPEAAGQSNLAKVIQGGLCRTPVKFDPLILRAFEYYTSTVFEVFDTSPTNRRSLFGGGRYDNLVSLFKKERIPGIGFGMGDVTLFDFLETHEILPAPRVSPDVYVFGLDADSRATAYGVARELQEAGFHVVRSLDDLALPKHLKYASRVGARFVIMAGLSELAPGQVALRNMSESSQEILSAGEVPAHLASA